ncbi:unnamed protein product [Prorocentrum cordatum]|uniref:Pentacotripeptide-repeat region of PRORP domain-containing protein n=1 Tax=Prorocentrum cordatum TaxID=2364126 RepID=A0ABN9W564_9DINO|nr:unnamed protein product [Polarella glacialis]
MLPVMMQRTAQKGSAGRACRKPVLHIVLLSAAFSALSQVVLTLFCSVFDMGLEIEFLPEVVVLACFLFSHCAGWTSNVRKVSITNPVIDKVAFDAGRKPSPAPPAGDDMSPKELCNTSLEESGDQVEPTWRLRTGMCAIGRSHTEGIAPTVSTFEGVMKSCIMRRRVEPALKLFDQMLEDGVGHDAHLIGKSIVDRFFNLVAENLDAARLRRDGLSLFKVVEAHGLAPSTRIQNHLMVAWKSRPPKTVVNYLLRMRSAGQLLSRLSYFCIIISSERSDPALVLKLCDELQSLGIQPDKVAYNAVLGSCCQLGMYDEAGVLFEQMANHGLIPDVKTYRIMLNVSAQNKNFEEAVAFFETMRELGFKPDRQDYHNVIYSCIGLQRTKHAVELYHDMVRADVVPCKRTVAVLTTACQASALSFSAV